jgi:TolB-like protein/Flp pilus assembly protein TadD
VCHEAQGALAQANSALPETRHINFRMGIHVGDVMVRAGDLFGDGVNIAARLQALARAGGLCVSGVTYDQVRKILPLEFTDLGAQTVKNIEEPIRAYEISGRGRDAALGSRHVTAPRLSIVVLPFANIGGGPEQDYFVDGVTESLTTDLSRISGALVIARNTAFTFKGKAVDIKQLGRELNVRYVLEGSVQRAVNRLRVNVQLIYAETGNHLWAERFDKPVADLFDMQDEIVARLANTLSAELIAAEARRAERILHPDAIDLYFQGMACIYRGPTTKNLAEARGFFERALVLDPGSIEALVGTVRVDVALAAAFYDENRPARLAEAETVASKVLALAPNHAIAHLFLGIVYNLTGRASSAIAKCERALTLDRNLANARAVIGHSKSLLGRAAETEDHVNEALRLSPHDILSYRWISFAGHAKLLQGDDAEAVAWLRRSIEANRNYSTAHFYLAAALALLGALDEARLATQAGLALDPAFNLRSYSHFSSSSDNPTYLAGCERVYEGMRIAGVPEG